MSARKTVAACSNTAAPEIFDHLKSGILLDCSNVDAITSALMAQIGRRDLSEAAYRHAQALWMDDTYIRTYSAMYFTMLRKATASGF